MVDGLRLDKGLLQLVCGAEGGMSLPESDTWNSRRSRETLEHSCYGGGSGGDEGKVGL